MKTTTKATQTTFFDLLRKFENATREKQSYCNPQTEKQYEKALQNLATACTFSVLKKLCNVGGYVTEKDTTTKAFKTKGIGDTTKVVRNLRVSTTKDLHTLDNITAVANKAYGTGYNKNGDIIRIVEDKKARDALNTLINECLGDGLDLVHTAIVAILTESQKVDTTKENFMEIPYTIRRLKKKVYIKSVDSKNGWETKNTTPIQEVFKAVRREVESNRSIQVLNGKYTYLETVIKDRETSMEEIAYKRLPKYSQLAYEITDYNGKVTSITSDLQTVTDADALIEKLNLTSNQAAIVQLRLSGYGYKAIATYLGVSHNAVINALKKVQSKAITIGLNATE